MGGAEASQSERTSSRMRCGDFALGQLRESQIAAIAGEQSDDVGVVVEARAFGGDVVRDDQIGVLGGELFAGILGHVVRLRGEADDEPIALCFARLRPECPASARATW